VGKTVKSVISWLTSSKKGHQFSKIEYEKILKQYEQLIAPTIKNYNNIYTKTKEEQLAFALEKHKHLFLKFIVVPFDNNQAERDRSQLNSCVYRSIKNENQQFEDLKHFTELSWNLYSNRLGDKSIEFYRAGKNEFDLNNDEIISKVIEMDMPKKISLSVTSDKNLHYTFMFNDFSLIPILNYSLLFIFLQLNQTIF